MRRIQRAFFLMLLSVIALVSRAQALPPQSDPIQNILATETTGEKPQSKVWKHDGRWWSVLPNSSGTQLRRLDGLTWTDVLQIASLNSTQADVKVVGDVAHILLFNGTNSELISLEYLEPSATYQLWSSRPTAATVTLDNDVETATIDIDSQGRMWLASDGRRTILVRYSDPPFDLWSDPITLVSGVNRDDIGLVTALPNGTVGVLWSDQETERFGFRVHVDGDDPAIWSADEVPASQSALNVGNGMADDHLNVAVGSDATFYAAVKTAYDTPGHPRMALLIRRPNGSWDDLYGVDEFGTRGMVLLDESEGTLSVVYTGAEGNFPIVYRVSRTDSIAFGPAPILINGAYNNVTSTKQNISDDVVILASNEAIVTGVYRSNPTISIADVSEFERNAGMRPFNFTVSLANPANTDITVDFATASGASATANEDYLAVSGTATIPAQALSTTVTVLVLGDQIPELNETFVVDLSNPTNATIADSQGEGTILNDDGVTSVADGTPTEFALGRVMPNPSRGGSRIDFTVPSEARVKLSVLDIQGREVAVLAEGLHASGRYQARWDGRIDQRAAPAGMYFVRYLTPGKSAVQRMVLMR